MYAIDVFNKAFDHVILVEGGYVDDPLDPGGKTKYGITEEVARKHGYSGEMKDLDLDIAKFIYKMDYWNKNELDIIATLSPKIALEIFDTGVNAGTLRAGRWLQEALNVLNRRQQLFTDLMVDGKIGRKTIDAFEVLITEGDEDVIYQCLNVLQGAHYIKISQNNENLERYIRGWMKRVEL